MVNSLVERAGLGSVQGLLYDLFADCASKFSCHATLQCLIIYIHVHVLYHSYGNFHVKTIIIIIKFSCLLLLQK